jgi:hypothetical protein
MFLAPERCLLDSPLCQLHRCGRCNDHHGILDIDITKCVQPVAVEYSCWARREDVIPQPPVPSRRLLSERTA